MARTRPPRIAIAGESIPAELRRARTAQPEWGEASLEERLEVVRRFRHLLVAKARDLAETVALPNRTGLQETYAAEIIPLADACRFVERNLKSVLRPRKASAHDRPWWCFGQSVTVHRQPYGVVLILAPWNYPILLPGVQVLQALATGNSVILKPGRGGQAAARYLGRLWQQAGLPDDVLQVTGDLLEIGVAMMQGGVDKVVLTGSAQTGRAVLRQSAEHLTPSTMELSGCDAMFVLPGTDLVLAAQSLAFGLRFNASATCIAPRRVFVPRSMSEAFCSQVAAELQASTAVAVDAATAETVRNLLEDAVDRGARFVTPPDGQFERADGQILPTVVVGDKVRTQLLSADLFAPVAMVVEVADVTEALHFNEHCPYALGASVFGPPDEAERLAEQVTAGCITINDLIVPTGDPRVPFGGYRSSGFGVTRGAEGLLEMTRVQTVIQQRRRWRPHLEPPIEGQEELLAAYLQWTHGATWTARWRAFGQMIQAGRRISSRRAAASERKQ